MSRLCGVIVAIPLALLARSAAAEPPAPAGWSLDHRGGIAVYAPRGQKDVELRLYPEASAKRSLEDWFSSRLSTAPAGVDFAGYSANQAMQDGAVRMAVGTGKLRSRPVMVVALACQKPDASKVFGELIAPQDEATLRRYLEAATKLVVLGCFAGGGTGDSGGDAPSAPARKSDQREAPRAAAKTEFRYLARDKKGLSRSSIEAVLYSWKQVITGTTMDVEEDAYLLLKNGKARELPPVPPEDFDAAAEQAAEPAKWGTWKKRGGNYVIKLAGHSDYVSPPGAKVARPAPANHQLLGLYKASGPASVGVHGSGVWSISYLRFTADHRFSLTNTGGSGGTLDDTTVVNRWDDDGSSSSVTNPNLGGGGTKRRRSTAADRQGTYRIDGYTLELRYDSGRVERRFFFLVTDRLIWFGDEPYLLDKDGD
jgi:hypothetical protein